MSEDEAIPAHPDNEYGWEKLYSERVAMAYGRRYGMKVRIARFQNCYGPEGTWRGGREKAPAAICRKVAEAEDGGTIEVWGDGTAIRSYTYVADMVEGIYLLMHSDPSTTLRRGSGERSGRRLEGPVGVQSRNFSNERIYSKGWRARYFLKDGIACTYPWVEAQVRNHRLHGFHR